MQADAATAAEETAERSGLIAPRIRSRARKARAPKVPKTARARAAAPSADAPADAPSGLSRPEEMEPDAASDALLETLARCVSAEALAAADPLAAWQAHAAALREDPAATLGDLREAVTTLEDAGRIARRVLGGAHPITKGIETTLRNARAALRARETPSPPGTA